MKKYGQFSPGTPQPSEKGNPGTPPPGMYVPIEFPSLAKLDVRTRDGRLIDAASFTVAELPRSIKLMCKTAEGHMGAEVCGRLDEVTVEDDGNVSGKGWLNADEHGFRAAFLVKNQSLRGNSVDLGVAQQDVKITVEETEDGMLYATYDFVNAVLKATTLLTEPAFDDAGAVIPDGWEVWGCESDDAEEELMASLAPADATPHAFAFSVVKSRPKLNGDLFTDPGLDGLTPLFVDEHEHVVGHLAGWNTRHLDSAIPPPRSRTNYAYFANGWVDTTDGFVSTGRLVLGGNHAERGVGWQAAIDHYANTCAAWADVAIGEDDYGIWVSGVVRPGTTDADLHAARASALSGDWRRIGANLELIAALSVNTPGFPNPRAVTYAHDEAFPLTVLSAGIVPRKAPTAMPTAFAEALPDLAYVASRLRDEEARQIAEEMERALKG